MNGGCYASQISRPSVSLFCILLLGQVLTLPSGGGTAYGEGDACPDLIPLLELQPETPGIGQVFDAIFRVSNQGDAAAGGFALHWYIDPPEKPTIDTPATKHTRFVGVSAGNTTLPYTEAGRYSFTEAGIHSIYVWVDKANEVANECDETNNLKEWKFTVGSQVCPVDGFESSGGDNSCASASLTTSDGAPISHNLCPAGDEDWVRFEAQAGVNYRVVADNIGADIDPVVQPYTSCDAPSLLQADKSFSPQISFFVPAEKSGLHYVQVYNYHRNQPVSDANYRLAITAYCSLQTSNSSNQCPAAPEISPGAAPRRYSFCEADEVDWVRFQATGGQRYSLSTAEWEGKSQPTLHLYSDCQAGAILSSSPRGSLTYDALTSGPVYVKISNGPSGESGLQSGYNLLLTQTPVGDRPEEPNDSPDQALALAADGTPHDFALDMPGDQDWFHFQASGAIPYRMETYGLDPSADTHLCLYPDLRSNAQAPPIACDDDSGSGKGSHIWRAVLPSGRYYLKVRHFWPDAGGPQAAYTLQISPNAAPCDGDSQEPNNSLEDPKKLEIGGKAQLHNLCPGNDEDWVRVYIDTPGVYALSAAGVGEDADPVIDLFEGNDPTPLFSNDDYQPGPAARILWRFGEIGNYYLRLRGFDGRSSGRGTEYSLSAQRTNEEPTPIPTTPTPTPTPTATPTPTVTPTPTATPISAPQTLILYNRERMARFFGETETEAMVGKLKDLAGYTKAPGLLIDINRSGLVRAAFAEWDKNGADVEAANRVTDAIRALIWEEVARQPTLHFLVLVGDDRVLPLRRVRDLLPKNPEMLESNYPYVSTETPLGQALRQGYSLTDDYYGNRSLAWVGNAPVYLPDLAVGRLIENPADIGASVDLFLAKDELTLSHGTVAGYENRSAAKNACAFLSQALVPGTDCSLIGNGWGATDLLHQQLLAQPPRDFHLLYLPGSHWRMLTPNETVVTGADFAGLDNGMQRVLILSAAAQGGLNLLDPNPNSLDLSEAYVRRGAVVVAFTGYTAHFSAKIALADRFLQRVTTELLAAGHVTVGDAIRSAKYHYWQEALHSQDANDPYLDAKTLHNAVFYGIPMYQIPQRLTGMNEFPSVKPLTGLTRQAGKFNSTQLRLDLTEEYRWQAQTQDGAGEFYELDGHALWTPERASQPLFYLDLRETGLGAFGSARNVLWLGAAYSDTLDFDPIYATVSGGSENVLAQAAPQSPPEPAGSWETLFPAQIDASGHRLAVHWGQFDPSTSRQRLYTRFDFEVTFSGSEDTAGPAVTGASATAATATSGPLVKIETNDPSGIQRVVVMWTDGGGEWRPLELVYEPSMYKWIGRFPARGPVEWFAQVVDGAGNVTKVMDKDRHFYLDLTVHSVYLPGVKR